MDQPRTTTHRLTRATFVTLLLVALAGSVRAQTALYSNARGPANQPGLSTGSTTASGTLAPGGLIWSELQSPGTAEANAALGFSCHAATGGFAPDAYRLTDDFVVPINGGGVVWRIDQVVLYVYTDGPAGTPPITAANLRIWNGPPGSPTSQVIFGDDQANRLTVSGPAATGLLRIPTTAAVTGTPAAAPPDVSRPIWSLTLDLSPGAHLSAGTYWLDWQVEVTPESGVSVFCPPVTVTAQRSISGVTANARQLRSAPPPLLTGGWLPIADQGKPASAPDVPQELPFLILGSALVPACGPADIGVQGGLPGQDGVLNNNDFVVFIDAFFGQLPLADRGVQGGVTGSDGLFNNNDFVVFIDQFFGGC